MRHFGGARLLVLLFAIIAPVPAFAAHWVYVGTRADTADRVMVDTASLQKLDRFSLVNILTAYAAPRTNSYNITMDRFVQMTALDCARRTFVSVMTIGYLKGKRVGSSHQTADWKNKTVPIPSDPISDRIYQVVCGPQPRK